MKQERKIIKPHRERKYRMVAVSNIKILSDPNSGDM